MVLPCLKVFWSNKGKYAGHSKWKMEKEEEEDRRRGENNIKELAGINCQLSKGILKQSKVERGCFKVICGAPSTLEGYGIDEITRFS